MSTAAGQSPKPHPHEQSEVAHELGTGSLVASLAVGAAFLGLWFWLLPRWLGFTVDLQGAKMLRLLACIPSAIGFAIGIRCVWDFGRYGRGTPAPFAPPTLLVVAGFYRYVRNPMYVGFFLGWGSLWVAFGRATTPSLLVAAAVVIGVHLFVVYYEEPTLRKTFGREYAEFCANVPRWMPRLHPWLND